MQAVDLSKCSVIHHNGPAPSMPSAGERFSLKAEARTDWWRKPGADGVDARSGVAAILAVSEAKSRSFKFGAYVRVPKLTHTYDQAAVFVCAGEPDDKSKVHWIKAGVEMEEGEEFINSVVAAPWSDWGLVRNDGEELGGGPRSLWVEVNVTAPTGESARTVEIAYAVVEDSQGKATPSSKTVLMRQVRAFGYDVDGKDSSADTWQVGVMTCGPKNDDGMEASFEGVSLQYL